jgi:hypothetical protein
MGTPSRASRTKTHLAIGAAVVLLFAAGAAAAYFIGKGEKSLPGQTSQSDLKGKNTPGNGGASDAETSPPTLTEAAFKPADTEKMPVGMVILVEFKVLSCGGKNNAHLNSTTDYTAPTNFAAHISAAAIQEAGKTKEQVCSDYEGKTIRVRGMLSKDPGAGIEVKTLKQVMIVPDK